MIFICPYLGNVIIPTGPNSIIFQRGRAKNHQPEMICVLEFPDFQFFHRKLVPPISAGCLWNTRICWVFPFFGYFQVVYYQHGESVGNLYIGKHISTVYDIYIYGPLKQFQEHGISQKLEVAMWICGYLRDICVIFQVANCWISEVYLMKTWICWERPREKDVISLYHLGVSENGVYPKWPFSSGKSVVFSWGILKWVEVEAKALFLNGCFA